ncbi:MAG: HYC_CC_PP family protein [Cyclobacteriaceae bacterium]
MIKKIFHIALSLILLVATTGMAISKHYCGGELSKVEMGMEKIHCCDEPQEMPDDCCEDEHLTYQLPQDDFQFSQFDFEFAQQALIAALPYLDFSALFAEQEDFIPSFDTYTSPPIALDLPVMLQSFLL